MQEVGKTLVSLDHLSEHYHIMIGHRTRNLLYSKDFERSQLLVDSEKRLIISSVIPEEVRIIV